MIICDYKQIFALKHPHNSACEGKNLNLKFKRHIKLYKVLLFSYAILKNNSLMAFVIFINV